MLQDHRQCSSPNQNFYVARDPSTNCQTYLSCPTNAPPSQPVEPEKGNPIEPDMGNPIEPDTGNPIEPTKCNGYSNDCKKCLSKGCAWTISGMCYDDCSDINIPSGSNCWSGRDYGGNECKKLPGPSPMTMNDTSSANNKAAATLAAAFFSAVVVPALL